MKKDLIKIIRRLQTSVSVILFALVFVFCWHVTDFEIKDIQLSKWGESGITAPIWNGIVCLLAISIFINSYLYIKHTNRIKKKKVSYMMFGFVSFCLFLVGLFNVNYTLIHNLAAWLYFFSYPLVIFSFTFIHKTDLKYKDWVKDVFISVSMIIFPLIFIRLFDGLAIAETVHILFVIIWNLKIALYE